MSRGPILELRPLPGFDFARVVEDIANKRPVDLSCCDVQQHQSVLDSFSDEFLHYIAEHGLSAFMNRQLLTEAVVKKGEPRAAILPVLHAHLAALGLTTELVIVDPYFFAATADQTYAQMVHDAILPSLTTLARLIVVTAPDKVNAQLASSVSTLLSSASPNLKIVHSYSKSFHDRFWLNPMNGSGFISGTSLNGLGKRYALLDRM